MLCCDLAAEAEEAKSTSPMLAMRPASSQMEAGVRRGGSSPVGGAGG